MASKANSRSKIVHRQTFQNSTQVVELTLRTIPKLALQSNVPTAGPSAFKRDCALRKEMQNVARENNNNNIMKSVGAKNVGKSPVSNKNGKASGGKVSVEILRTKSNKKHHKFVAPDQTWGNVLKNCSTVSSVSDPDGTLHSTTEEHSQPVNEILKERTLAAQSESLSSDSKRKQFKRARSSHRHIRSAQTSVLKPDQCFSHVNLLRSTDDIKKIESTSISKRAETKNSSFQKINTVDEVPIDNNSRNEGSQSQHQNFMAQSEQVRTIDENNRLLSDDVNASPFGESALQLLRQLKERLQSRGDSEGSGMVGALEAFISGQGTSGGVGNPPFSEYAAASRFPTVFPTPTDQNNIHPAYQNIQQDQIHSNITSRFPQDLYSENLKIGTEVEPDSHTNQNEEGYMLQNVHTRHKMNDFPRKIPDHPVYFGHNSYLNNVKHKQSEFDSDLIQTNNATHDHLHHIAQNTSSRERLDRITAGEKKVIGEQEREMARQDKVIGEQEREIARQNEVIAEHERAIAELRKISTRLIAQQEQIAKRNLQQVKEVENMISDSRVDAQAHARDGDSGVGIDSHDKSLESITVKSLYPREEEGSSNKEQDEQNSRSEVLRLQTENAALLREVRSHRELVLNLEIQLTKAHYLLDLQKQSLSGLSASKLSSSAPNLDIIGNQVKLPSDNLSHKVTPLESSDSDADSAYEEKSLSHLTSKMNSPHSDRMKEQDSGTGSSEVLPKQQKQIVQDMNAKVQGEATNLPNTFLLQNRFTIKECTVPSMVLNSAAVSLNRFKPGQVPLETQKLHTEEIKSPTRSRILEPSDKVSEKTNFLGNSKKERLTNLDLIVSDLDPKPYVTIEETPLLSFSSINDPHDSLISHEASFLKGINAPRHDQNLNPTPILSVSSINDPHDSLISHDASYPKGINAPRHDQNLNARGSKFEIVEDNSRLSLHPPLESTRVQESSQLLSDARKDASTGFVPIEISSTGSFNTQTTFQNVDMLE
ncbi:uncharacterized protein [Procambarus clarkii]|uniref:uncharacterized protein isoform X2 n=1 Tax=Procambarus clarkii TaxID=6728 RepID=UPI001E6776CF|nr:uncharacterized protein LOC123767981 isoform X2 [Procambarus clarkii]